MAWYSLALGWRTSQLRCGDSEGDKCQNGGSNRGAKHSHQAGYQEGQAALLSVRTSYSWSPSPSLSLSASNLPLLLCNGWCGNMLFTEPSPSLSLLQFLASFCHFFCLMDGMETCCSQSQFLSLCLSQFLAIFCHCFCLIDAVKTCGLWSQFLLSLSLSLSLFLQFLVPATCCFECSRHLFPTKQDIDVDGFTHQFLVLGAAKMQNQNPENLIVRLSDSISI